jgi:hypothetical protein
MFGQRFKAGSRAQLRARATVPYAGAPEAIWHQAYDTQNFVTAATLNLSFFQVTSVDPTISNMSSAGQFPDPQWLTLYDITLDFLNEPTSVAAAPGGAGQLLDIARMLLVGRAIWTLTISDKNYGPYSASLLHGTGGPVGFVATGNTAATGSQQYGSNALNPGWNYQGSLIIPPKTNFAFQMRWAAVQTINLSPTPIRASLHGILSRRSL